MKQQIAKVVLALLAITCAGSPTCAAQSAKPAAAEAQARTAPPAFATVGGTAITYDEYNAAFRDAARDKFYHGRPPEGGIALLQREVGDQLVTRVLLLREAKRRKLQPDQESVSKKLEDHEQRYANSEQWKKAREQALPALKKKLAETSLLEQLEKAVRDAAVPSAEQVAAYYAAHPDKFTEPEQLNLKVILLKVDPSSPREAWEKAEQDAQDVIKQLREGADFAELARQRSGDAESAGNGGDLGYRHSGMLPEEVVAALGEVKLGDLSPPVRVLQGYTVFRLVDRKLPRLVDFDASRERAQKLLQREQGEAAWKALAVRLKKKTPPKIDTTGYLPLPDPAAASSVAPSAAGVNSAH